MADPLSIVAAADAYLDGITTTAQITTIPVPRAPLIFGPGDLAPLAALFAAAPPTGLHVALVPCLGEHNSALGLSRQLAGYSTHVPAGHASAGVVNGVVIAVGPGCGSAADWHSAGAGAALAHELGHALGLWHTVETGGGEDHLADTDADNLMAAQPAASSTLPLSASQRAIIRAHPLAK